MTLYHQVHSHGAHQIDEEEKIEATVEITNLNAFQKIYEQIWNSQTQIQPKMEQQTKKKK